LFYFHIVNQSYNTSQR